MPERSNANEIRIIRIYDAPVETVWDAWTDPDQIAQWWGPRGFTTNTHSKDLRPGGSWVYNMRAPDGMITPIGRIIWRSRNAQNSFTTTAPTTTGRPFSESRSSSSISKERRKWR